jgi:hypothetical protein
MDRRIIENIRSYEKGLTVIDKLKPVTFNQKVPHKPHLGLVSQDVHEIEPLLINSAINGTISVDYDRLLVVLVNAIKELSQDVETLKKKKGK